MVWIKRAVTVMMAGWGVALLFWPPDIPQDQRWLAAGVLFGSSWMGFCTAHMVPPPEVRP